jgi:hypothetical protein
MAFAFKKVCLEQRRNITNLDWAVSYATMARFNFNQRLEPQHASRPIANNLNV